ncbi:glycine zipper 2TM domain-containing protein [Microbulbifer taiwanensis]|uniref:Glycine zipper 2TM domain-containing protein n=1 Tax=Microbulbifer taiwanensis TaxID=986746 RepID=A0ABW1YHS0_9GAMM|nr:glycine zipper 2TM domain-containing protein [Microbulbifer taiwanensis]
MQLYKQLLAGALVAALVGFSARASAGDSGYYPDDGYDYAAVTEVTPIYTDVQVRTPRTQCWDEQVAYQQPVSPAGTVIGGLIGAAIGNNLGKRGHRGRHHYRHYRHQRGASTVAGAAVGALVGNQISRASAPTRYVTEQRCQVVDEFVTHRELVGYDVRYRYNGREYLTRTDQHPGDRIRVRVDVSPAF